MEKENFKLVRNHILTTRKQKLGYNYNFTGKNGKQIKQLLNCYLPEEVMAAWDVFLNDKMDDPDRFWTKGYTIDMFCCNRCFSVCQESSYYKGCVSRHEKSVMAGPDKERFDKLLSIVGIKSI